VVLVRLVVPLKKPPKYSVEVAGWNVHEVAAVAAVVLGLSVCTQEAAPVEVTFTAKGYTGAGLGETVISGSDPKVTLPEALPITKTPDSPPIV